MSRRFLPRRPCLTQALVARRALRKFGVETSLHIGAQHDGQGRFAAHAWIERDGRPVIGDNGRLSDYVRFTPLADRAAQRVGTPSGSAKTARLADG